MVWPLSGWWAPKVLCANDICAHFGRGVRPNGHGGVWTCRQCRQPLPGLPGVFHAARTSVLILVGTEGSGKSSWLIQGLQKLESRHPLAFPLDDQDSLWEGCKTAVSQGFNPPPTPAVPTTAWCVDVVKGTSRQRLHIHDLSGLEAADQAMLSRHRSFEHVNYLLLALDPFSLPAVRSRHGEAVRSMRPPVRPASQAFGMEHLGALLSTLENLHRRPKGPQWDIAVAVMLTKLNVLGLMRKVSEPGASLECLDQGCRQQLASWDGGGLVRALDSQFRQVRYFAPTPAGEGVFSADQPLLWALGAN